MGRLKKILAWFSATLLGLLGLALALRAFVLKGALSSGKKKREDAIRTEGTLDEIQTQGERLDADFEELVRQDEALKPPVLSTGLTLNQLRDAWQEELKDE